jgi:hypothetical protein
MLSPNLNGPPAFQQKTAAGMKKTSRLWTGEVDTSALVEYSLARVART